MNEEDFNFFDEKASYSTLMNGMICSICNKATRMSGEVYIYKTGFISSAWSISKMNFCPNCGRPLTEEACAELERRINGGTTD